MNKAKSSNRELLLKAALQKIPCDLTIENIQLINVITGEIYPAEVDVFDGIIVRVRSPKEPLTLASLETFNEWVKANTVEELKGLLNNVMPPVPPLE